MPVTNDKQVPVVTTTVAKFPRGVVRSAEGSRPPNNSSIENANTRKTSKPRSMASSLAPKQENPESSNSKRDATQDKMLRFLRWSASDVSRTSKNSNRRDRKSTTAIGSPSLRLRRPKTGGFNSYSFYTKNNTHKLLLDEEENKRMAKKSDPGLVNGADIGQNFEAFYSAINTKERVKEWAVDAYKMRLLESDLREPVHRHMSFRHTIMSPSSLLASRSSMASPHPPVNMSRRSSMYYPRRRSSVFWVPPVYDELSEAERKRQRSIRTFRWYGRLIRNLVGLLMDMKRLSISKTQQSAYSEFLYIIAGARTHAGQQGQGEDENQFLLFDKSWFSRNRAWSRMPPWAQRVMQLSPDQRTAEEIDHLKHLLMTMRSFRENLTDEMRRKICQVVRYTRCDKGRVVLRQGHVGFDFYFIFSGSVFVQFDTYDDKTGETYTSVENVLKSGVGFGEIALLGDGVRTASVICKGPTELCQIDKTTFLELCPAHFNEQLQEKIKFARQFPIFKSWEAEPLKQLCFLSQVLDVPHSTVVIKDWASSHFAYFVIKGRVSMLKEFDVTDIAQKTALSRGVAQGSNADDCDNRKRKSKYSQFAHVGMLHEGDCSDLSVLSREPRKDMTHITLVSEGARLFRVAVRTFQRLGSRKTDEEYLKKIYKPRTFPSEKELCTHYLRDLSWSEFKKAMVRTHQLERAGHMACVPATLKGTSGWARWPGYVVMPRTDKSSPRPITAVEEANRPTSCSWNEETKDDIKDESQAGVCTAKESQEHGVEEDEQEREGEIFQEPRPPSPNPLDADHRKEQIYSDHSLILLPPLSKGIITWKKNLRESSDDAAFSHIFRT